MARCAQFVQRCIDNARCDRVHFDLARREFERQRTCRGIDAAFEQRGDHRGHTTIRLHCNAGRDVDNVPLSIGYHLPGRRVAPATSGFRASGFEPPPIFLDTILG